MKINRLVLAIAMAGMTIQLANAADADSPVQADKITVLGSDSSPANPLEQVANVSKAGVTVEELPMSVSVIDKDFMQNTGAKNIQDALLYTAGAYAGAFGADTRGDWVKVRGVDPLMYLDGLRSLYGSYNNTRQNIFTLEQIEVMKGPASSLYGQSSVGGIINSVTKRPKEERQGEFWAQVGNNDRKQLATDWTGKVDEEGKLLVRLVGLARDSGTQVDHVDHDELLFTPSVTWRPNSDTQLTLLANLQKKEGGVTAQFLPTYGTLLPGPKGQVSPDTFIGEPDWDRYDREQKALTAELEHRLNDNWKLTAVARYVDGESETREHWVDIGAVPDADGNVTRTVYSVDRSFEALNVDARINGNFDLGVTQHRLVVGIDRQDANTDDSNYMYGYGQGGTINLYNPVYGNVPTSITTVDRPSSTLEQTGVYLSDHISFGNFIVSAGIRYDETSNQAQGSAAVESDATTRQLGLMYKFDNGLSPYFSFAEAFTPNTGDDGMGNVLKPTEGEQVEFGIKYLSADRNTAVTFARFDIEQQNRIATGTHPGGLRQIGAQIDGWELELQQRWQDLSLRLALTDMEAVDGSGTRLPYTAEQFASAWLDYNNGNGWRMGAGARYTGSNVGWGGAPEVDGITLYDAMVGYRTGPWDFSLDVKNLTDEEYVSWCRSPGTDCGYGEKMTVTANTRYYF